MKAIDLFEKQEELRSRISKEVRQGLKKFKGGQLNCLEQALNLDKGCLNKVRNNKSHVDIDLFEIVGASLGISVFDIFGKPKWTKEARSFWEKEREGDTMYLAAGCNGGHQKISKVPLNIYVTLRAVQELRV